MISGVVDTTVIIHLYRKNQAARVWLSGQADRLGITPITWLEVMYGAPGKAGQVACKVILSQFEMLYLTPQDMDWAMQRLETYRLSHGVETMDCLIASVSYRLQLPLYTHNLKDMQVILGTKLTIKPYSP
jgi:predicted nucleic acid-binding protein